MKTINKNTSWEEDVAKEIGEALAEQEPGAWDAVKHGLKAYTYWKDCVEVLGYDKAIEIAKDVYYKKSCEIE